MRQGLLCVAVVVSVLVCPAAAATTCSAGQNLGMIGSCAFGPLLFDNFKITGVTNVANPLVTLGAISAPSGGVLLEMSPNFAFTAGLLQDLWLSYRVTASRGSITGVELANGGTSKSAIFERLCSSGLTAGGVCAGGRAVELAELRAAGGETDSETFSPQTAIWVFTDILAPSGEGISAFAQRYSVGSGSAVPEPVTLILIGSGLLALGIIRRWGRKV